MENENKDMEDVFIAFEDEDGKEANFRVICALDINGKSYAALAEQLTDGSESDDVEIFRYIETEDGMADYEYIEDDDEYDAIADKFNKFFDQLDEDIEQKLE